MVNIGGDTIGGGHGKKLREIGGALPGSEIPIRARELANNVSDTVHSGRIAVPGELTGNAKQASYGSQAVDALLRDHGATISHDTLPGERSHVNLDNKHVTLKSGMSNNQSFVSRVHALDHLRTHGDIKKTSRATRWKREVGSAAVSHLVAHELNIHTGHNQINYISHFIRSGGSPARQEARLKWFESHLGSVQNRAARIVSEIRARSAG